MIFMDLLVYISLSLYIYIYIYMYTHMCVYVYIYIYIYLYTCSIYALFRARSPRTRLAVRPTRMISSMLNNDISIYIYVYVCICVYIYICLYTYTHYIIKQLNKASTIKTGRRLRPYSKHAIKQ